MNRKRWAAFLLLLILLLSFPVIAWADNRGLIVYIASGSSSAYRYHAKADCSSLSRSAVASITLEEAASRGLSPCTRCHPPKPDFEVTTPTKQPTAGWDTSRASGSDTSRSSYSAGVSEKDTFQTIKTFIPAVIFLIVLVTYLMGKLFSKIYEKYNEEKYGTASTVEMICFIALWLGLPLWIKGIIQIVRFLR